MTTTTGDRWATVSGEWPATNSHLHRVDAGKDSSACGTTALPASLWRARPAGSTKPRCLACLAAAGAHRRH